MVLTFDNPLLIPKLIKLAEQVPGTPLNKLKKFMFNSLNRPNAKAYMDMHDGVIKGFIYSTIEEFDGEKCVFIQFCVLKPCAEDKYIGFDMLNKIKLWAKENNITQIYFSTARDIRPFIKKYHFKFYSSILKLDLNEKNKGENKNE